MSFYGLSIVVNFASPGGSPIAAHTKMLGWISVSVLVLTIVFVLTFRYTLDTF
jgi:hypothetical protein